MEDSSSDSDCKPLKQHRDIQWITLNQKTLEHFPIQQNVPI